ncbi:component of SufBCD complex [Loktanella sp. TSTF-M6]|uniref:Component of SufBCD complex n=1 Tax=Loktanella gaetbuli TaxID=2881335 RepID=A0ABS8BRE6_9RHOB|nr:MULTISPECIES: component of SufBCD complex [Loktanella]MCB5198066.1 component of SufBCD complex [Loktanella gaetbuli]
MIDFRSFSSIWYWVVLALMWSSLSYYVIGVPYDLVQRARRKPGQARDDLVDATRISVTRLLSLAGSAGVAMTAVICFFLSSLAILGFYYWIQLAQALFFLSFPLTIVGAVSLSTANKIYALEPEHDALIKILMRHRLWVQIVGMISIFITAMFGMAQNLMVVRAL